MKNFKMLSGIIFFLFIATKSFSQGMMPPPPIDSPVMSSMEGTWVSEPYQFMGSTMTDECTQKMVLNGQFMEVNVKSTTPGGFTYEAIVLIAPSSDGTLTGTSFDVFGEKAITSYTGTWKGNMLYLDGRSSWGIESRVINIDGDVMLHNVIYKMKDEKGNPLPDQSVAITYNKKN